MERAELFSSLNLNKFIALDFETTGLQVDSDRIIEVAAILFVDGLPHKKYTSLVNPGIPIPSFIEEITGITNAMVKDSPKEKDMVKDFFQFIGDYPIVAHNTPFDLSFLDSMATRYKLELIEELLASKEMYLARYYVEREKWIPAINRFKKVVEDYDETIYVEEAIHRLVEIHYKIGLEEEAKAALKPDAPEVPQEVALQLTLEKEFDELSEESARRDFEASARLDISYVLSIEEHQIVIKDIRAGSVILDCSITGLVVLTGSVADFCQQMLTDDDRFMVPGQRYADR